MCVTSTWETNANIHERRYCGFSGSASCGYVGFFGCKFGEWGFHNGCGEFSNGDRCGRTGLGEV